jgi:hypothetical protein
MSAESVVSASLRQLDRDGPVVCIPGARYRVLLAGLRLIPRRLLGRLTGRRAARV